jgi:EAL domain-containing protein (putative c-di-GMP-specific phosphodiesterase class I)
MRAADLAMYAAKAAGPGSFEFYAEHMHESAVRQLELTSDLYQALERDELDVYFQPIVSLDDEVVIATEALVRWKHPRHGILSPGLFMPIAEETGLIVALGRFVLRRACAQLRRWQLEGLAAPAMSVAVNLGRQQLIAPDLLDDVRAVLTDTGLDPACLTLEITEDVLLARDGMLERLQALKQLGVRLAVDDFGTGYSALSHLRHYPIDIIKIDKAFVDDIGERSDQVRLIRGIVELTHSLGLRTVAEGIETAEQAEVLRAMGAQLGQGFHFARPLPIRDLEALLAAAVAEPGPLPLAVELRP